MREPLLLILALLLSTATQAQKWRKYLNGEVSYVCSYIYRGMDVADHTGFGQLNFTYKGLTVGGEFGVGFDGKYVETQLSVGYTYKDFTLTLRDQYFPIYMGEHALGYFNWNPEESSHQLEVMMKYSPKKIPLRVMWSTYVAGYDLRQGYDDEGNFKFSKRAFSSYLEFTVFHQFRGMHTLAATMGFSVLKGLYTGYQADFAFVNTRISYSKTWACGGVYPTVGTYLVLNGYRGKFYPVAFASLAF